MAKRLNQDTIIKLGHKIRIERQKRKMSQEKLAELAELNRNFVGMVERGETNITVKNIESIANAFEINIHELFVFII
ncbi:helix-turn-helix domain protein [Fusobacterium sp. CAG:439]|nr:helix-turn-helix domain protein [Fusobacterium sp. CAG:439]HIT92477.1 helix-turn-helix transcriptional regulator [Candidatus Stercorousia faecigallinarum]